MSNNHDEEIITTDKNKNEVIIARKSRSITSESIPVPPTLCGLMLLHTSNKVPIAIIKKRCLDLGYEAIFFPPREYDDDDDKNSTQLLKDLETFVFKLRNKEIIFVLADANYNIHHPERKTKPNTPVLMYVLNRIKPKFFFVNSATEGCLEKVLEDRNLEGIIISNNSYSQISETVPPTEKAVLLRKTSIPHDSTRDSDELNVKVKQKTILISEETSIDNETVEKPNDELTLHNTDFHL